MMMTTLELPDEIGDATEEQLRSAYWDAGLTTRELADEFDITKSGVRYWMKKYDIDRRQEWSDAKKVVECKNCGESFERYPGDIQGDIFCSNECHNQWQRENGPSGNESPAWKGGKVSATCYNCGDEFEEYPSRVGRGDHTFCSRECAGVVHEGIQQQYNGRDVVGTHRWRKVRGKIIERDNGRCQSCGFDGNLHVHHIEPLSEGGEPFDPDNLVTLCRTCHISVFHAGGTKELSVEL